MTQQIICAGFGGQGALLLGQMLTYAGMIENKYVSWLPSYGPEMRGGTANCSVIISDEPVGSPVVTQADAVIAMNRPSFDKFKSYVKKGGKLFINSSLIQKKVDRRDIAVYYVPASEIAVSLGNTRVANTVMMGAYLAKVNLLTRQTVMNTLKKAFEKKKTGMILINRKAFDQGVKAVSKKG